MPVSSNAQPDPVVVRTHDGLPSVRGAWDVLRAGATTPNADPDRYAATLCAMAPSATPYVALFPGSGPACTPAALLVGRMSRASMGVRLGYWDFPAPALWRLDVVYDGILTDGSTAAADRVYSHVRGLLRSGAVSCVRFNHLRSADAGSGRLLRGIGLGRPRLTSCRGPHLTAPLASAGSVLPSERVSVKHRKALRRLVRRCGQELGGEVTLTRLDRPEQVEGFLKAASRVAPHTWQAAVGAGFKASSLWHGVLRVEAQLGRFRGYVLGAPGLPIAFQFGTVYSGSYALEAVGFDQRYSPYSPGKALLTHAMDDLYTEGVSRFDFGFGDAVYKRAWASDAHEEYVLDLFGRGPAALLVWSQAAGITLLRECVVAPFAGAGFMQRVRKRWRKVASRSRGS